MEVQSATGRKQLVGREAFYKGRKEHTVTTQVKELVREAMLGEGVERVDEVEPRIMENGMREAV